MASLRVELGANVIDRERTALEGLFRRLGFRLAVDEEGVLVASRPRVIEKPEFKKAITDAGVDTEFYGGVAWGRLQNLSRLAAHDYDWFPIGFPAEFISGGWSGGDFSGNLLAVETLPGSIEWAKQNKGFQYYSVNDRVIDAWQAVSDAYNVSKTEPE